MNAPAFIIRAAGPADLEAFKQLRALAGPGFTSFQLDDAALLRML